MVEFFKNYRQNLTCGFIATYNRGFQQTDVLAAKSGMTTIVGVTYLK